MIYVEFENSDEPDERYSPTRVNRNMAEWAIKQRAGCVQSCGCEHPYAVILAAMNPETLKVSVRSVKASCCPRHEGDLMMELRTPVSAGKRFAFV